MMYWNVKQVLLEKSRVILLSQQIYSDTALFQNPGVILFTSEHLLVQTPTDVFKMSAKQQ